MALLKFQNTFTVLTGTASPRGKHPRPFQTSLSDPRRVLVAFRAMRSGLRLSESFHTQSAQESVPMSEGAQGYPWESKRVQEGRLAHTRLPLPSAQGSSACFHSKSEHSPLVLPWRIGTQKPKSRFHHRSKGSYLSSHGASRRSMPKERRVSLPEQNRLWMVSFFVPGCIRNLLRRTTVFERVLPFHDPRRGGGRVL